MAQYAGSADAVCIIMRDYPDCAIFLLHDVFSRLQFENKFIWDVVQSIQRLLPPYLF
jgi:hypothetical protein